MTENYAKSAENTEFELQFEFNQVTLQGGRKPGSAAAPLQRSDRISNEVRPNRNFKNSL